MTTCSAFAVIVDTAAPVDRETVVAMSRRFPRNAFEEPQFVGSTHAVFAVASMRGGGASRIPPCIAADGRILVADAHFHDGLTLLHVFEQLGRRGDDSLLSFRGDFALVYWDEAAKRLIAARDFFGKRPLYYAASGTRIALSNCLESLREVPWVSAELRPEVLASFVIEGGVQDPATTVYRDIQRLVPAHTLAFSSDGVRIERYWRMPIIFAAKRRAFRDVAEEFMAALRSSVARVCDNGSAAISMSGGMDSTSVAAIAASLPDNSLQAFTVGRKAGADEERDLARETATRLAIPWTLVDTFDMRLWERMAGEDHLPFPLGAPQFARMRAFLEKVAESHSVLLSGEGGDELMWQPSFPFAGSFAREGILGAFRDIAAARANGISLRFGLRNFLKRAKEKTAPLPDYPSWLRARPVASKGVEDPFSSFVDVGAHERFDAWERLQSPMFGLMFEYLHPTFTRVPVEYRWPMLDRDLIELTLGLPGYPAFEGKALLRQSMRNALPQGVLARGKIGVDDPVVKRIAEGDDPLPPLRRRAGEALFDVDALLSEAKRLAEVPFPRNWMVLRALEVLLWLDDCGPDAKLL